MGGGEKQTKDATKQGYASFKASTLSLKVAFWQGRQESNPQPAVLETAALPIELRPYLTRDSVHEMDWYREPDNWLAYVQLNASTIQRSR